MNINRMLNTFIAIFLVFNIALYGYNSLQGKDDYRLTGDQAALFQEVTDVENIIVYTELPEYSPRPRLLIHQPVIREQEILDRMVGDNPRTFIINDGVHVQETDQMKLTFNWGDNRGYIYYAAKEVTYMPVAFNDAGYNTVVYDFVSDFTLDEGNYELRDRRESTDGTSIIYYFNERFEGELLFCNEVLVKVVKEKGITEARSIRYLPVAYEETVNWLQPVDEAIYGLIAATGKDPDLQWKISDIEIGYYLGPDDSNRLYDLTIEPHYRLKLGTGETFLINAYTKELVEE